MRSLAMAMMMLCLTLAVPAVAAPMMQEAKVTVTGTIQAVSWQPARILKGKPGMSGTLGGTRTFPAHYTVALTDTQATVEGPNLPLPHQGNVFELSHPKDDGLLKASMKVRIVRYSRWGDEGGVWTSFERIEILDGKGAVVKTVQGSN